MSMLLAVSVAVVSASVGPAKSAAPATPSAGAAHSSTGGTLALSDGVLADGKDGLRTAAGQRRVSERQETSDVQEIQVLLRLSSPEGAANPVRIPETVCFNIRPDFVTYRPGLWQDENQEFQTAAAEVPLPMAAWVGLSGLATVAGFGILRRRRLNRY